MPAKKVKRVATKRAAALVKHPKTLNLAAVTRPRNAVTKRDAVTRPSRAVQAYSYPLLNAREGINVTFIPFEALAMKAMDVGMSVRLSMSKENVDRWDDFFLDVMEWLFQRNKDRVEPVVPV